MTKEQNEGTTPTANTAASTTEQSNATAEQAAPTTQASIQAEPTATSSKPEAQPASSITAAAPNTTQQRTAATPPPLPKQVAASSEAPQTADDLKAQLASLQARLDAMETKRTTEARTAEIERIIAPLSDTLKTVYRRTAYTTLPEADYNTLRSTIQAEVSELAKSTTTRGAVFGRPTESIPSGGKASDKETAEVLRRLNL